MRNTWMIAALAAGGVSLAAGAARAGGYEIPDNGTEAMGRAGAYTARASDPTALMHNTAAIVGLPGVQIDVSSNFSLMGHCFQRAGNYDNNDVTNIDTTGTIFEMPPDGGARSRYADNGVTTPYPRVCNDAGIFVAPQLLATWRIHPRFAIGVGVYGPNSIGTQHFPDTVQTMNGLAPSPARYELMGENLLIIHPTIAVAGAPLPWLRIGAAIQPSFANFSFSTMANSSTSQSPAADVQTAASASGFFLAGNLGLQLLPSPYFTFGAHFHYNPDHIDLSGSGTTTSNYYSSTESSRTTAPFTVNHMIVALPWQARVSARFALPRNRNPERDWQINYNPMRDDVFDVEVEGIFERSSNFDNLHLELSNLTANGATIPMRTVDIAHNFRDVWGVRVGGDVNILPDRLAVRAGFSYETGAQQTQFANLDLASYDTFGLHLGASYRFHWGDHYSLTASLAYAHFFMADQTSTDGTQMTMGATGNTSQMLCDAPTGPGPGACNINRGTYSASVDTLSAGVTLRL